jgi:hypothetical protein
MIKASAKGPDGRTILVIGLSFGNLDKFRAEPGDTFIKIDGRELGMSADVMIFSGKTEADCAGMIADLIEPQTTVTTSGRLKN